MRIKALLPLLAATALTAIGPAIAAPPAVKPAQRPNLLIIVADDLGFSDLGAFGGEISTPNLDALARSGVRFTGFHTTPMCSPSRAMLLTGTQPHHVGLGNMAENTTETQRGREGYQGFLKAGTATLAELLGNAGYQTILSGKWHLGQTPEQDPHARGFQRSFALLQAGHNPFGVGMSVDPTKGSAYTLNGMPVPTLPADFYSSDYFTTKMVEFLDQSATGPDRDKPFFAYLSFTAPHSPLQAPPADIAKYRGKYDQGFDALRKQRLARQAALGLRDPALPVHPPQDRASGWDRLSPEQKAIAARDMEVYAAMVDRMDRNVGRVIAELKRTGRYDNTVILFLSDNGAEGIETATTEVVQMRRRFEQSDNSLANRGAATSYFTYGPGWASASSAPSWLYKSYATEGGSRTVSFLSGPKQIVGRARIANSYVSAADVVPTFLELAGVADPKGRFRGRAVEPIRGTSFAAYLAGRAGRVHPVDEPVVTEIYGSRSVRKGDWKITDLGDGKWHLFNIARDPGETRDLIAKEPARFRDLLAGWDAYARDAGVILPGQRPDWR